MTDPEIVLILAIFSAGVITGLSIGWYTGYARGRQDGLRTKFQPPKSKGNPIT
jgi:hypothetical protein